MNDYEARQEARRARFLALAERFDKESNARYETAMAILAPIPPGQPILIGHHSEKRHRRALERHDTNMRKSIEARDKAAHYRAQAEGVGKTGRGGEAISSHDPDAVQKLTGKAGELSELREHMKKANAFFKKHKTLTGCDVPEQVIEEGRRNMQVWGNVYSAPFPPYSLQNLGARIRQATQRAETIEATPDLEGMSEQVGSATVSTDDGRVLLKFRARLSRDDYKRVRSAGFVWSPTRSAFVRRLSPGAVEVAKRTALAIVSA